MMKSEIIDVIAEVAIAHRVSDAGDEIVSYVAGMQIDCDGSGGNPDRDPDFQPDTTLHHAADLIGRLGQSKALNAYEEAFIVVPPTVCKKTTGKVLGSLCLVENTVTRDFCFAVVGDIGPHNKAGEASPAVARQVKVDPNPVRGGTDRKIIRYTIFVGVPARINGLTYSLQSFA